MSKATKVIVGVALVVIVAAFGFIGGFAVSHVGYFAEPGGAVALSVSKKTAADKVADVDALLQSQALQPPNEASATAGSVQGLLGSNGDKYATYFDATHFKAFSEETQGSFGGIGVVLGENKQGQAYVVEVYPGTPAAKAGIKQNDIFLVIDGTRQDKWTQDEVVKRVRGPEGTQVKLTLLRPNANAAKPGVEVSFTITRAMIDYPNTKTKMYGNVGYVRLGQFNANAASDMDKAINELTKKGAKSLVFDLREDPGGLLDQAVDVSSLFIPDGVIVRVDERNKPEVEHSATGHKITDLPLTVLIDGNSASASEITAGALQDYGRATLVGEKSFGKGSVQTIVPLSDGSAVKFTIAHYLTPRKRVINGLGLTPDYVVAMDPMKQTDPKTDTQLNKAIELARAKIK
ncbi:MAG TPA: S41 family peptidase [Coriobacteriia bacterium]